MFRFMCEDIDEETAFQFKRPRNTCDASYVAPKMNIEFLEPRLIRELYRYQANGTNEAMKATMLAKEYVSRAEFNADALRLVYRLENTFY